MIVERISVPSFLDAAVIYKFTRYMRTISHMNYVLQDCSLLIESQDGPVFNESLEEIQSDTARPLEVVEEDLFYNPSYDINHSKTHKIVGYLIVISCIYNKGISQKA